MNFVIFKHLKKGKQNLEKKINWMGKKMFIRGMEFQVMFGS